MGIRRQARECALQMLYQLDLGGGAVDEVVRRYWETTDAPEAVRSFASELVAGVAKRREALDQLISKHSANWKLSRMAAVDRNILRIAAFEFNHRPDIPIKVTINEAVEVAKRFGTSDSGAFVNGILDNMAKELTAGRSIEDEK
jgi:N utilization substance protein B